MKKYFLLYFVLITLSSWCSGAEDSEPVSLQRMVGQLFIVGTPGKIIDEVPEAYLKALAEGGVGGFIPYAYNIQDQTQLLALNEALRRHATASVFPRVVDVEGGRVNRLRGWMPLESHYDIGERYRSGTLAQEAMEAIYAEAGRVVRSTEFDMALGPVVDIHDPDCPVIGKLGRAFPDGTIVDCAAAFVEGFRREGVKTCLKHFCHGSSKKDTHEGYVDVTETFDREREVGPYEALGKKGLVDAVMPAHVVNRALDPAGLPATLSRPTNTVLREAIGITPLIISDAMDMGAITEHFSVEDAAVMALKAGTNMLIYSCNKAASASSGVSTQREGSLDLILQAFGARDHVIGLIEKGDAELEAAVRLSYAKVLETFRVR